MQNADHSDVIRPLSSFILGDGAAQRVFLAVGFTWKLNVPIENLEDATVLIELRRSDTNASVGWSYVRLHSDSSKMGSAVGIKEIVFIPGLAPPVGEGSRAAHALPALPALNGSSDQIRANAESMLVCSP